MGENVLLRQAAKHYMISKYSLTFITRNIYILQVVIASKIVFDFFGKTDLFHIIPKKSHRHKYVKMPIYKIYFYYTLILPPIERKFDLQPDAHFFISFEYSNLQVNA